MLQVRALNDDELGENQVKNQNDTAKTKVNDTPKQRSDGVLTALRRFFDKLYIDDRAVDGDPSQVPQFTRFLKSIMIYFYRL